MSSMLLANAGRMVARRSLGAQQQVRGVHFENVVNHTLPTNVTNKPWLAIKIATYFCCGFGLPFGAAAWHIRKSAGAAA